VTTQQRDNANSKRLRINSVRVDFPKGDDGLRAETAKRLGVPTDAIEDLTVVRESLDARHRPTKVYNVDATVDPKGLSQSLPGGVRPAPSPPPKPMDFHPDTDERVVVIGAGPSGLFCAHRFAESGVETILLDRGEPVETRGRDVSGLMHRGELKPDSNICFGEGGAGTWSDGKLYTRVSDVRRRHVLETIVDLGGPEEILVKGKPHLGTNRLVRLCKAFRSSLRDAGCTVRFGAFVDELIVDDVEGRRQVSGVRLGDGETIDADRVVLAVGHSAREMYRHLADIDVAMEPKAFAVGFRVEHRQQQIDEIQYGKYADMEGIPTADYSLSVNYDDTAAQRGVYSFCMCPGGQIVPSHTLPEGICVNGMSHASRRGHWANSALVVTVEPQDFGAFDRFTEGEEPEGLLAGMAFQHEAERRAYKLGGGGFIAPAQRLTDFRDGVASKDVRKTTYKPGIIGADLRSCYPPFVTEYLQRALDDFDEKMPGYVTDDALLIGVETRTSAPVRILRDDQSFQSTSVDSLYPIGEGAGYGGGIVSSAIDGLRIAERVLEEMSA